ncbi:uncharacterized protein LOC135847703 [Planococcus citri]|uniref:uncharacterized protein LOC135847703 n=1 Tax=Planococcus citri TaxID=170843 RepID=UPI0031F74B58
MAGHIENPFSFINTPSSLQLLAASEIALSLWQYKYSNSTYNYLSWFVIGNFRCEEMLVVPPRFKVEIDERILAIRVQLRNWIDFHKEQAFFDGSFKRAVSKSLKLMVIDSCGGICFKATAINILNSNQFNVVEKYKVAVEFCFKEHVKKIWPSVEKDARVGKNLNIDKHSLMFYWNRRMKSRKPCTLKDTLCVKTRLENARKASNWPAFEYFWSMQSKGQVKLSQSILYVKLADDGAIKRTLPSLKRTVATKVFEDVAPQILHFLVRNEKYFQHVHRFWTVVEHTVYEKESSLFQQVLHELWEMVFNPIDISLGLNNTRCQQINEFLIEVWSRATDNLKNDVYSNHVSDFFHQLSTSSAAFPSCYGHNMDFMLDLLGRNSNKEQIWHENWRKLVLRANPVYLERFLAVCLPDDDVEKSKKELLEYERIFELLIEHGMYSEMKNYLNFCLKDKSQFQEQAKRLIISNFDLIMFHDDGKFAKFDEFVGEMFSNVSTDIEAFKFALITSFKSLKLLKDSFDKDHIDTDDLDFGDIETIIGRFVSSEQNAAFKQHYFNVDKLFEKCLLNMMHFPRSFGNFRFFVEFFEWYFPTEEDRTDFKLQTIANREPIKRVCAALRLRHHFLSNVTEHDLLMFLFDNNVEKVYKFQKKLMCESAEETKHVTLQFCSSSDRDDDYDEHLISRPPLDPRWWHLP